MSDCFAVFHCAAELKDKLKMYEVNVVGTRNIYNAICKNEIRYFCYLSSVGVIGKVFTDIVDENTLLQPNESV